MRQLYQILLASLLPLMLLVGCRAPYHPTSTEDLIEHASQATVRLSVPGRSCTAFHVGDDIFVTAAHCLDGQDLVFLQALDGESYLAIPIAVDEHLDLATLHSTKPFIGPKLEIYSPSDGSLKLGAELLAVGYPGYYEANFFFEIGWLKDFITRNGVRMLVSSNLGYPGYSGGPVLSIQSGHVVGVNDLMSERVAPLGDPDGLNPFQLHQHNTLSLFVGPPEILFMLDRTEAELAKPGGS